MSFNQGIALAGFVIACCGNSRDSVATGWVLVGIGLFFGLMDLLLEAVRSRKGLA